MNGSCLKGWPAGGIRVLHLNLAEACPPFFSAGYHLCALSAGKRLGANSIARPPVLRRQSKVGNRPQYFPPWACFSIDADELERLLKWGNSVLSGVLAPVS
jgi:hypothetical protein